MAADQELNTIRPQSMCFWVAICASCDLSFTGKKFRRDLKISDESGRFLMDLAANLKILMKLATDLGILMNSDEVLKILMNF